MAYNDNDKRPPKPRNVTRAQKRIGELIVKHGTKKFKKKRDWTDRVVSRVMKRYKLKGKMNEDYWRLTFITAMIGAGFSVFIPYQNKRPMGASGVKSRRK